MRTLTLPLPLPLPLALSLTLTLTLTLTQVHPADLDGALQSTKVLASGDGGSDQTRLPFSIDTALMRGKANGSRVRVRVWP